MDAARTRDAIFHHCFAGKKNALFPNIQQICKKKSGRRATLANGHAFLFGRKMRRAKKKGPGVQWWVSEHQYQSDLPAAPSWRVRLRPPGGRGGGWCLALELELAVLEPDFLHNRIDGLRGEARAARGAPSADPRPMRRGRDRQLGVWNRTEQPRNRDSGTSTAKTDGDPWPTLAPELQVRRGVDRCVGSRVAWSVGSWGRAHTRPQEFKQVWRQPSNLRSLEPLRT